MDDIQQTTGQNYDKIKDDAWVCTNQFHSEYETQPNIKLKKKLFKHFVASDEQPTPFADGWPIEAGWQVCEKAVRDAKPATLEECWKVFEHAFQTKLDKAWCREKLRHFYEQKLDMIIKNGGKQAQR